MQTAIPQQLDYFRLTEVIYRVCVYLFGWSQRKFDQAVEQRAQQLVAQETTKVFWRGFATGLVVGLIIVLAFSAREVG